MKIDFTVLTIGDLLTIFAALLSPLIAIQVSDWLKSRQERRARKLQIFRTLMSTRATTLAPSHVEALNSIDMEFDPSIAKEKRVIEAWKLYHSHLGDASYNAQHWPLKRFELLVDMLYEMSLCMGYRFDKTHIKHASYHPKGYGEVEEEQHQLRKAILAAFNGSGVLRVTEVTPTTVAKAAPAPK